MKGCVRINVKCPECGGAVSFSEEALAFKCPHCSSAFLVSGASEVMCYYVASPVVRPERVELVSIRAVKNRSGRLCRILKKSVLWAPFRRIKGRICWYVVSCRGDALSPAKQDRQEEKISSLFVFAHRRCSDGLNFEEIDVILPAFSHPHLGVNGADLITQAVTLCPMSIQNDLPGERLPVEISFNRAMSELGRAVNRKAAALAGGPAYLYSKVTGFRHSVVYRPFSVVYCSYRGGSARVFVDMLSGRATRIDFYKGESAACLGTSGGADILQGNHDGLETRSLLCPGCGWDLHFRADASVFVCEMCKTGWTYRDGGLERVSYMTGDPEAARDLDKMIYMPFWLVIGRVPAAFEGITGSEERRDIGIYVPAFKCRCSKTLGSIMLAYTQKKPHFSSMAMASMPEGDVMPASLPVGDAALIADVMTYRGCSGWKLSPHKRRRLFRFKKAVLIWLPFKQTPSSVVDPISGIWIRKSFLNRTRVV